jgi:hypothetical protein
MRTLGLSLLLALAAPVAHAAPCADLPNAIYLQVGDTQSALMRRLGRALRDNTPKPITLVWFTAGSCINISTMYTPTTIASGRAMQYVASAAEDPTWTPATANRTCEAPTANLQPPDIGNSALFNSACTTAAPPATLSLTRGPAQAYVLAVPKASNQTAITSEEAYFVFGFGAAGMITPWVNETQLFIRAVTTSTLLAWAANIGVPADKWKGDRRPGSPEVVTALQTSTSPQQAIGILGAEVYDQFRDSLLQLAFRARGQQAAYYPDSTYSARDKKNVRDGHYTVWSPTIWMDFTSGGNPVKPDARYIVDLIAGHTVTPAPNFDMISIIAAVGLVPDCAMGVTREVEGGPLSIYRPTESCACKFESVTAASSCQTCTTTCATGTCRNGFCEVQ